MERESRQELEILDQKVGVVVEGLDDRVEVLDVGCEVVLGLGKDVGRDGGESLQRSERIDDVGAVVVEHLSAFGRASSVRPRLSLLPARIAANRFSLPPRR